MFAPQFGQMQDAPGDHHVDREARFDAIGAAQLPGLDLTAAFERAVIDLDAPTRGIPGDLLGRLLEALDCTGGQQHPFERLDALWRFDLACPYRPYRDGFQFALDLRGFERDARIRNRHLGHTCRTLVSPRHLKLLITGDGLARQVLPELALLFGEHAVLLGANQQFRRVWQRARQVEELEDVGFAVADTHHHGVRAARLEPSSRLHALEPLIAFLRLDRHPLALVLLAELLGIARPALHVNEPQGHSLGREGQGVVHHEPEPSVGTRADGAQVLDRGLRVVIEARGVLHRKHHRVGGYARTARLVMRLQDGIHGGARVIEETVGGPPWHASRRLAESERAVWRRSRAPGSTSARSGAHRRVRPH